MYDIDIKGDIISDDSQWIYDWIGWSYTSAKNVIKKLKEANGQPVRLKVNSHPTATTSQPILIFHF